MILNTYRNIGSIVTYMGFPLVISKNPEKVPSVLKISQIPSSELETLREVIKTQLYIEGITINISDLSGSKKPKEKYVGKLTLLITLSEMLKIIGEYDNRNINIVIPLDSTETLNRYFDIIFEAITTGDIDKMINDIVLSSGLQYTYIEEPKLFHFVLSLQSQSMDNFIIVESKTGLYSIPIDPEISKMYYELHEKMVKGLGTEVYEKFKKSKNLIEFIMKLGK